MSQVRVLKIPASVVRLVSPKSGLIEVFGNEKDQDLELFVPDELYLQWADIIQQSNPDGALFYCGTSPYVFRPVEEGQEPIRAEDLANRTTCLVLIDEEIAAKWLIDHPYEVSRG